MKHKEVAVAKKQSTKKYDEWEIEDMCRTLEKAGEIMQNKEKMALCMKQMEKKTKSLDKLRKLADGG